MYSLVALVTVKVSYIGLNFKWLMNKGYAVRMCTEGCIMLCTVTLMCNDYDWLMIPVQFSYTYMLPQV